MKKAGRQGVSAEVYGDWNKKDNFIPPVIPKSEETKLKIQERLSKSFLFSHLDPKDMEIVIQAMQECKFSPQEDVIKQGDNGEILYVVE
jgi:cAMP-dependent protein kinase regulator